SALRLANLPLSVHKLPGVACDKSGDCCFILSMYSACVSRWMVLGLVSFAAASGASNAAVRTLTRTAVLRCHCICSPSTSQGCVQNSPADHFGVKHAPASGVDNSDLLVEHARLQADDPKRNPHAAAIQNQGCWLPLFRDYCAIPGVGRRQPGP